MIDAEEIKKYLPYYLTDKDQQSLLKEIKNFPENIDDRFFTNYLKNEKNIFQGDGYKDFLFVNFPDQKIGKMPAMVISNSCDIDLNNKRLLPKRVVYAPIFQLEKYRQLLIKVHVEDGDDSEQSINSHIEAIKKQHVSDIFYLPPNDVIKNESIVMLDRLNNSSVDTLEDGILEQRLFTLSNFGFYLFLIKLSIHFSRVKEEINRSPEKEKCA